MKSSEFIAQCKEARTEHQEQVEVSNIKKYKGWCLYNTIPKGWKIDSETGSPLHGYVFITDRKSILFGGKRALLKIQKKSDISIKKEVKLLENSLEEEPKKKIVIDENYTKTVNKLAREKFKERLLQDIMIDLTICDIEGWDKKEYIKELVSLINGIKYKKEKYRKNKQQLNLFDLGEA